MPFSLLQLILAQNAMISSRNTENIYMLLPRFVFEPDVIYTDKRHLPEITRDFERNGVRFDFIISPALIYSQNDENRHYYPGKREEVVETALRELSVEENPSFIKKDLVLMFRLGYLLEYVADNFVDALYTVDEIELSLHILSGVVYNLDDGGNEMCVRPIEELSRVEKNNEIYYYLQFSSLFLGDNQVFDYCFGDKNPNKAARKGSTNLI